MQEVDIKTIASIGSVIATFLTVYLTYRKSIQPLKKSVLYYENILLPFIQEYHKNPSRNWSKFIQRTTSHSCDYVPPYIFYIVEHNEYTNEHLKIVLLNDYRLYYRNDFNSAFRIFTEINKIGSFAVYFFSLFFLIFSLISTVMFLISVLVNLALHSFQEATNDFRFMIVSILLSLATLGLLKFCSYLVDDNTYTLNKKRIKKNIKTTIRGYKKWIDKYYL